MFKVGQNVRYVHRRGRRGHGEDGFGVLLQTNMVGHVLRAENRSRPGYIVQFTTGPFWIRADSLR